MEKVRITKLNDQPVNTDGTYVLYWMQQSQRAENNHALEYGVSLANKHGVGLLVCFILMTDYPEANQRHFAFMLEGLSEVRQALHARGIKFIVSQGEPPRQALNYCDDAIALVCDKGYLRHQRSWRETVAAEADVQVIQIEADAIVPVELVSDKREYAARTIRPKLQKYQADFLTLPAKRAVDTSSLQLSVKGDFSVSNPVEALESLELKDDVSVSKRFTGGLNEARKRLQRFIVSHLTGYADSRNDPGSPQCSELSPYLHFGQISPAEIARKVQQAKSGSTEDKKAFLEELIVRRELAFNFVYYEPHYDEYKCLPEWARKTLKEHRDDKRPHQYSRSQMENGETHDDAWNSAMLEMRETGYMHNYMRMYWGKKILEWTNNPEYGFQTALYLNNKYFLDGRDPCSFTNVAWLFGLHDRGWQERQIFGKVRYMNEAGLRRKFDIDKYSERVKQLIADD